MMEATYSATPLADIRNVSLNYEGRFMALSDLTLTLEAGRIYGLLGPNGSGKTTLIKILAGLLQPTAGSVTIEGMPVGPETKAHVSYLPDHPFLESGMTIAEVMALYADFYQDFDMQRAEDMLVRLKLAKNARLNKLSKGTLEKVQLILVMSRIINNDPEVSPYLRVVMVENYNVSYAEHIIPACDISEQISLASKEASGTGNMKFMLNGAITLGTEDGANVEIAELVGHENIFTFGASSEEVIEHYAKADYVSRDFYEKSPVIKEAVDFIVSTLCMQVGNKENLTRLYNELLNKDWFMTLLDLEEYIKVKDFCLAEYENRAKWRKMMLVNIAKAGFFSSDRTIAEYNRDIWKLKD